MKIYGGVILVGGEWSTSCPSCFTPGEEAPSTLWVGGCGAAFVGKLTGKLPLGSEDNWNNIILKWIF
jgi:hypothetical protein